MGCRAVDTTKKYVSRALEWLWKVDSHNIKYSISNSPKGVLDVVFCAWINGSALSVEKKIESAKMQLNDIQMLGRLLYLNCHMGQARYVQH